jgi:hypothetical protein
MRPVRSAPYLSASAFQSLPLSLVDLEPGTPSGSLKRADIFLVVSSNPLISLISTALTRRRCISARTACIRPVAMSPRRLSFRVKGLPKFQKFLKSLREQDIGTMTLTPLQQEFVLHFGEMGSRWGINRTVGQIYALLFLSRPR